MMPGASDHSANRFLQSSYAGALDHSTTQLSYKYIISKRSVIEYRYITAKVMLIIVGGGGGEILLTHKKTCNNIYFFSFLILYAKQLVVVRIDLYTGILYIIYCRMFEIWWISVHTQL